MSATSVRPRRVLRNVLAVLAVVGVGVGAVATVAWCSVFGCSLFPEEFEPRGEQASRARAGAVAAVTDLADRTSSVGRVLATASADGCVAGQNTWKRKDTHAHECEVSASRIVVVTTDADEVAAGLTAADLAVRSLGCRPDAWGGLDRVRDEYWTPANPNVARDGAAGLPSGSYTCAGQRSVVVQPTSAVAPTASTGTAGSPLPWFDDVLADEWYGADAQRALSESGAALALVVTADEVYYRTRF